MDYDFALQFLRLKYFLYFPISYCLLLRHVIKPKRSKNLSFIQVSFLLFLDIDECALGIDSCSDDGICDNNIGSYTCRCKAGFSGDGRTCTGIVLISLHLMFLL